jgi:ribonuclease Y
MDQQIISIIVGVLAGLITGYFVRQTIARRRADSIEAKVEAMASRAKKEAQDKLLEAQEKSVAILDEAKKEASERQSRLNKIEELLLKREESIEKKIKEAEEEGKRLKTASEEAEKLKGTLQESIEKQITELERVSSLSREEAKEALLGRIEKEHEDELLLEMRRLESDASKQLERRARDILASSLQRYASSVVSEVTTTYVDLPSEELKGRIIGKEGRNIKTLERLTGVDVVVDEAPDSVMISSFDPIRRQVARVALEDLIKDGRIQPARIEEAVEKAKEAINEKVREAGEAAVFDVGVSGLDERLVQLLGRLRYRTSFGQNVLLHSIEAAHIAGMLAQELGADVQVAKKGALLHDIGKAIDHEVQGTHVEIGIRILEKFNVSEDVIVAMRSHHGDWPHESVEAIIVQVAESISAARPGARKDTVEAYLKRLEDIERIVTGFEGVEKTYAVHAGREVRIFVLPEKVGDFEMHKLAKDIAKRLEEELKYPGEIKVHVIRETRAVEYAK